MLQDKSAHRVDMVEVAVELMVINGDRQQACLMMSASHSVMVMNRLIRTSLHASDENSKSGGDRSHRLRSAAVCEQATTSLIAADVQNQRCVHLAEKCGMRQQSATLTHHTTYNRLMASAFLYSPKSAHSVSSPMSEIQI